VLLRCLTKDLETRYPSAAALAHDLERLVRGETTDAQVAGRVARGRRAALALGVAAVVARTAESVLTLLFGSAFAADLQLVFLNPLAAEAAKGVAVLLLVWLLPALPPERNTKP